MVDKCDCSNIESLFLRWITFSKNDFVASNINEEEKQLLLKQMAEKFSNLKYLKLDFYGRADEILLLFVKHLKSYVFDKNNVEIQFRFDHDDYFEVDIDEYTTLVKFFKENNIGKYIHKLDFVVDGSFSQLSDELECIRQLCIMCRSSVEHIAFSNWDSRNNVVDEIHDYMSQVSFKSLKVFEYSDDGIKNLKIDAVNKFCQ